MAKLDYYLILEVKRSDSRETIKKSYRRLARQYHPDQNPENIRAEERFKAVVEAWEVLGDPERRRLYDLFGHRASGQGFPGYPGPDLHPIDVFDEMLKKVRDDLKRRLFRRRGSDLRIDITLTMREVLLGSERVFELPRVNAAGEPVRRRVKFTIPRGVSEGRVLRWKGQGAPGKNGGQSGDLLVRILVEQHPIFHFESGELVMDLYLTRKEADRGVSVAIPSPWGARTFAVPAHVSEGDSLEAPLLGGLDKAGNRRSLWLRVHVADSDRPSPDFLADRERLENYVRALHEGKA